MKTKLLLLFALSPLTVCSLTGCDAGYSNNYIAYAKAMLTLEQQEKMYPTSFLTADGTYRKNLLGEWVMEGTVGSTATVAKYKDVVLTISYYSKTKTLLGTEQRTIYDYITPGSGVNYMFRTSGFKGVNRVGLEVLGAITAN